MWLWSLSNTFRDIEIKILIEIFHFFATFLGIILTIWLDSLGLYLVWCITTDVKVWVFRVSNVSAVISECWKLHLQRNVASLFYIQNIFFNHHVGTSYTLQLIMHPWGLAHLFEEWTVLWSEVFVQGLDWSCGWVLQRVEGIDELAEGHYHLTTHNNNIRGWRTVWQATRGGCIVWHLLCLHSFGLVLVGVFNVWWTGEFSMTGQHRRAGLLCQCYSGWLSTLARIRQIYVVM